LESIICDIAGRGVADNAERSQYFWLEAVPFGGDRLSGSADTTLQSDSFWKRILVAYIITGGQRCQPPQVNDGFIFLRRDNP
jgi:hypothetical protein